MKNYITILILLIFASCGTEESRTEEDAVIIKEIESEGYNYIGEAETPSGICDTVMLGHSDRVNGVFFNKTERFKTLKIKGYQFEKEAETGYTKTVMIYRFNFSDLDEQKRFERFQKFINNDQSHSKNKVKFYQKDATWFLRFEPMI